MYNISFCTIRITSVPFIIHFRLFKFKSYLKFTYLDSVIHLSHEHEGRTAADSWYENDAYCETYISTVYL